jgi:hypothetical protein
MTEETAYVRPEEANWRAEFELRGENELRDGLNLINHEPKRQLAFRWLREQDHARRTREQKTYNYVRWTFWAAVAAVIVGVVGVAVTLLH